MPTLQVTLPEPLWQFVQSRVVELGLDHSDQYFEQLLEEERRKKIDEYYMEKVREGLESGPPIRVTPGFWDAIADKVEQENRRRFDDDCIAKVQEAIDQNEWIPEEEFWRRIDENTRTRRNSRKQEAS